MNIENDILRNAPELREMPFSVPEGYFDGLRQELSAIAAPRAQKRRTASIRRWIMHPVSAAAVLALIAGILSLLPRLASRGTDLSQEDFLVFSDNYVNTVLYSYEESQTADAGTMADEDIVEYLIYTGVSAETIELSR